MCALACEGEHVPGQYRFLAISVTYADRAEAPANRLDVALSTHCCRNSRSSLRPSPEYC